MQKKRLNTQRDIGSQFDGQPQKWYYALDILPTPEARLVLNAPLGILSCFDSRALLAQAQFSVNELRVLCPLLEHYPTYCPLEEMFARFYHGILDDATIVRARLRLQEAREAGTFEYEMRPIRNVISRMR